MKVDYHIHTHLCGHAEGTAEDYVQAALQKGIEMMAFTDHAPLWYLPSNYSHQELKSPFERLERYLDEVRIAQWWYAPYPVALGMELDFIPGQEECMARTIEAAQPDYVLGSVHFIDGALLYEPEAFAHRSPESVWVSYLELSAECAETHLVDCIAHIDVLKAYLEMPASAVPTLRQVVRRLARADVCVELNTSGLRNGFGHVSPGPDILRLCREAGVEVTLGSDAHHPSHVGAGMEEAANALLEAGYDEIVVFSGRQKQRVPILQEGQAEGTRQLNHKYLG